MRGCPSENEGEHNVVHTQYRLVMSLMIVMLQCLLNMCLPVILYV